MADYDCGGGKRRRVAAELANRGHALERVSGRAAVQSGLQNGRDGGKEPGLSGI